MTRSITDHIAVSTTPANTGASADACRIVAMLFEHDSFTPIARHDRDYNTGHIAHLCRRVTQELEQIELDKNMAELDEMNKRLAAYASGGEYDSTQYFEE